jgi:uncharacterized NAD(P)/FAD-binding protein YdhS
VGRPGARADDEGGTGPSARRVVIVGGGASGGLVATQLLRRSGAGVDVRLVEPRAVVGLGAAFSTLDPWHRLNVVAATMSALPDDPDHFRRWIGGPPDTFASRMDYGRYLQELLAEAVGRSAASFSHVRARATRLLDGPDGLAVAVDGDVDPVPADAVVLATGNQPPAIPAVLQPWRGDPRLVADPWAPRSLDPIVDGEAVAILGSGHTALDLAASVLRRRPRCTVVALSRRGELPCAHEDPWRPRLPEPLFTVEEFLRFADPLADAASLIRTHGEDWRPAFDSLRPIHQQLWRAMDLDLRRRFLADWRRTWEIHRSRVPPAVMGDTEAWIAEGRLAVRAGTIAAVDGSGTRLRISVGEPSPISADRILLATGPDERATANPLLAAAIADGLLRPDPLGLGPDVDPATGRVRDAAGATTRPVYAMGPLRRGAVWETIAIPEIRVQASEVAAAILGAGG